MAGVCKEVSGSTRLGAYRGAGLCIENPVLALSYIFGRLSGFARIEEVTMWPVVAADAVAECVAIAQHFLPQMPEQEAASGVCYGCGEDIAPEFIDAATQIPPDYLPEGFRKRATVVLCELCRTEGE